MALFRWFLNQKMDISSLKREVRKTYLLFQEYTLFFKHKKDIFGQRLDNSLGLKALKPKIDKFHQELILELSSEQKIEKAFDELFRNAALSPVEKQDTEIIAKDIQNLRKNILKQSALIDQIIPLLSKKTFEERYLAKEPIKKIRGLLEEEQELLFKDEEELEALVQKIIQEKEYLPLKKIDTPGVEAATLANQHMVTFVGHILLGVGFVSSIPRTIARTKFKTVFYPGSGGDLVILFCFPNAQIYVLQDPQSVLAYLRKYLMVFNRTGIIQDLEEKAEGLFTFRFNGQKKMLSAYYGSQKGDSTRFIPPEIRKYGVGVMMGKAFTVEPDTKEKVFQLFQPYLLKGSYVNDEVYPAEDKFKFSGFKKIAPNWWIKL